MQINIEPPILYFGTPVVLISTLNEDASSNLVPMTRVTVARFSAGDNSGGYVPQSGYGAGTASA